MGGAAPVRLAGRRDGRSGAATGRGAPAASAATDVRVAAVRVIERLLDGGGSLTRLVPEAQATLPEAERALLQAFAFGLARWSGQLTGLLERSLERPLKRRDRDVHLLLQLGLFQLLHTRIPSHAAVDATVRATRGLDKPWARGLVNAVLRNQLRRGEALLADLDEGERLSHPDWLLARLRSDWPEHWRALCEADNRQAPMTLRVNLAATDLASCRRELAEAGHAAAPLAGVPTALVLERAVAVGALPGFAAGRVSVQDGAAQLAVGLLLGATAPAATRSAATDDLATEDSGAGAALRLLDACAAPGGKCAQALESGRVGELVALDRDPERLERVHETLERIGCRARATLRAVDAADTDAWWDGRAFDAVLLDAPCTGTGVIRRHPDIKLLRRASDVDRLVAEQLRLLDALWPTLAPGGSLLYTTCSVLRAEGEEQVVAFLARRPDATLVRECRVLTGTEGMDGFYHALLTRDASAS